MNKDYFQAIHQIITTGHWITDEVGKALKAFGITEPQYNVLKILNYANGQPVTVGKISDGMVQRSSNVTRIVDKLLSKGLVNRQECPTNRRKMDITITAKGCQLLIKLDKKVSDFHQPMMKNLTKEELVHLQYLITKLKERKND